jgi:hypothetical protein
MQLTNFPNMPHQTETLKETAFKEFWAWFLETGLGKTKLALDNALMLHQEKRITGLVAMAPKGAYLTWSDIEIPKLMPSGYPFEVAVWSSGGDMANLNKLKWIITRDERLKILIINTEGVLTPHGYGVLKNFLTNHKAMWVLDESTSIKNPKAKRAMAIIELSRLAEYRRIMTGFPINKEPVDVYNQLCFLTDNPLGFDSWYAFRGCFQIMKPIAVGKRIIQQNIGTQNEDVLNHRLKWISTRYRKADCLKELPPKQYATRVVELTKEQRKHYEELRRNAFTFLSEQDVVTATMVMTQIIRLQQITCGFAVPDDDKTAVFPLDNNRVESLIEMLEEHDGKVVIWTHFVPCVKMLAAAIGGHFGVNSVATYYGATSDAARLAALVSFQDPKSELRYFVGNPATGKFSLTLTEARLCLYYSNSYDLEARRQSEDRLHRKGQVNAATYVDFISPKTVDMRIVRNLIKKQNMSDTIMGDKWKEWFI